MVGKRRVKNLFMVGGNQLITPDTSTDILEGITRDTILEISPKLGINVQERSIDRTELYKCEEAFLCGSSAKITPILSIDRRKVGNGEIGPITKKLMKYYSQIQKGEIKDFAGWRLEI